MSLFDKVANASPTIEALTRPENIRRHGVVSWETWAPSGRYRRRPATPVNMPTDTAAAALYRSYLENLEQSFPAIGRVVLRNASVLGQGTVVLNSGKLLIDTCRETLLEGIAPTPLNEEGDPAPRSATRHVPGPTLILKRPSWQDHGHWLVDAAALLAFGETRLGSIQNVVVGRCSDPMLRNILWDTVATLAPGKEILEQDDDDAWSFDSLHVVTPLRQAPLASHPLALQTLRRRMLAEAGTQRPETGIRRKLLLSVSGTGSGGLANEAEISAIGRELGFETIHPERLSLVDQVRVFHEASVVLGVKGAALGCAMFMQPGSTVIPLTPGDWPDPFLWDLVAQQDINYREIFGARTAVSSDLGKFFEIDIATLREVLEPLSDLRPGPSIAVTPDPSSTPGGGKVPPASLHGRSPATHDRPNRGEAMFGLDGQIDRPRLTGTIIHERSKWWFETSARRNSANPLQGPFDSIEVAYDFAVQRRRAMEPQGVPQWGASVDYSDPADLPSEFASWQLLARDRWTYTNMRKGIIYRRGEAWWFEPYAVFDHANPISGPYFTLEEAIADFY